MDVNSDRAAVDRALDAFSRTTEEVFTLDELRQRMLSGRQLVMKYGVDLTAPHLHLGHAVNLWMYRALQDLGHKLVLLLGDFTTQIGDPTGKSKTRPVMSLGEIETNAEAILSQALKVIRSDPEVFEVRRNSEWLDSMRPTHLLSVLSQVTVDRLLSRDMFRKRMAEGSAIAANEFLYPVIQGWDSVCLNADLTIIGTDQLFNEMMGRTLQERQGQPPQVVITTKITPGLDGIEKQSKSLGNYVAIDHSAREKFGRLMKLPDALIQQWLLVYSDLPEARIAEIVSSSETEPMKAKYEMANAIVARYHGLDTAEQEESWFRATFSERNAPEDAPVVWMPQGSITVYELVRALLGDDSSNSDVRRLIKGGGVRIDSEQCSDQDEILVLDSSSISVKVGKRRWFQVRGSQV